jgi:hypothetical protein
VSTLSVELDAVWWWCWRYPFPLLVFPFLSIVGGPGVGVGVVLVVKMREELGKRLGADFRLGLGLDEREKGIDGWEAEC